MDVVQAWCGLVWCVPLTMLSLPPLSDRSTCLPQLQTLLRSQVLSRGDGEPRIPSTRCEKLEEPPEKILKDMKEISDVAERLVCAETNEHPFLMVQSLHLCIWCRKVLTKGAFRFFPGKRCAAVIG